MVPELGLHRVREDVAMRQHRRLRDAGRAAGVLQHRDVIVRIDDRRAADRRSRASASRSARRCTPGDRRRRRRLRRILAQRRDDDRFEVGHRSQRRRDGRPADRA